MREQPQAKTETPKRNDPCPCNSGRKYKHCCAKKDRADALQRDFAGAHFRRGVTLESGGRVDEAIEAYRMAAACGNAPEALSRLGHLFTERGLVSAARDAFRAAAATGETAERRLDLVRALMIEGAAGEAEAEARRAVSLDPRNGYGFWLLGRILAEAGRFAESRDALERSIQLEPQLGGAYYDLVRTGTLGEADRPLVNRMLKVSATLTQPDQLIRLHLALGKAFDDLGEIGQAMLHFERASRIKETLGTFDRGAFARRIDRLIERFTPDFIAAHMERGDDSELPIMIVGMPRSGTTLVEQIISSHDRVGGGGEMQFWSLRETLFDKAAGDASIAQFQRRTAKDCLATLRAVAPDAARVTDKDPFNFLRAGMIHLTFPRAVIIHCRRDPIDTCLSVFSTYFRWNAGFSTGTEDLVFYYRQYQRLMNHWRATLRPDRLVEVEYEALVDNPEQESRRLVAACGLEWQPQCLRPQANTRVVRSASRWQARQPIYRAAVGRWRRYEPWIGAFRQLGVEKEPAPGNSIS
jgi:tetratricopeptide (TPR) repeat protein